MSQNRKRELNSALVMGKEEEEQYLARSDFDKLQFDPGPNERQSSLREREDCAYYAALVRNIASIL